jgi:quinol monooxygenase YgiN
MNAERRVPAAPLSGLAPVRGETMRSRRPLRSLLTLLAGAALALSICSAQPAPPPASPAPTVGGGGAPVVVVAAIYRIKAGHEAEAIADLRALSNATHQEKGNLIYAAHRSLSDPRQFLLYEQYESPAALAVHQASSSFQRYAVHGLQTIAESRTGGQFTPLPPE